MKIRSALRRCALSFSLATLVTVLPSQLFAQGTAFTYQGRLTDNGAPATGTYDVRFILYTADPGGNQSGPILTNSATPVAAGLFTVSLDFGSLFNGSNYWMEIAVRTNGTGSFTTLSPRQKITPTPYAVFAESIATNGLAGTFPNAVALNNVANQFVGAFSGNGAGLTGVDAATLGGLASSNFWKTTGNAGTTPAANFLGTTDNQPLELKVGGSRAFRLEPAPGGAPNVIGGSSNNVTAPSIIGATIAGGYGNTNSANFATVGGGFLNSAASSYATVAGGQQNASTLAFASVGGGLQNISSGGYATIAGGYRNTNSGVYATIAGGANNISSADGATTGGGNQNTSSGPLATIAGGYHNLNSANSATIGGGALNTNTGDYSTIGGGQYNICTNQDGTVGGGSYNVCGGDESTVGGGILNRTIGFSATVGGGFNNTISGNYNTISGGGQNTASGNSASVGGGQNNQSTADYATVAGGIYNSSKAIRATVAGGEQNSSIGSYSTVGGGYVNISTNNYATIPGGAGNIAGGQFSFAAGHDAHALHDGSFVWSDGPGGGFDSTRSNQFLIRASGGIGLGTANPVGDLHLYSTHNPTIFRIQSPGTPGSGRIEFVSNPQGDPFEWRPGFIQSTDNGGFTGGLGFYVNGAGFANAFATNEVMRIVNGRVGIGTNNPQSALHVVGTVTATAFNPPSDRNLKENFEPVEPRGILDKVAALPISRWNFKDDATVTHVGPMAQDFQAAFHVGTDDRHIATVDADGVALAAIQGLNQKIEEQRAEVKKRDALVAELEHRLAALESKLGGSQ